MQIIPQQIVFSVTERQLLIQFIRDVIIPNTKQHPAYEEAIATIEAESNFPLVETNIKVKAASAALAEVGFDLNEFLKYIDNFSSKGEK